MKRKRLVELLDGASAGNKSADWYDLMMMVVICASMVPLMFKDGNLCFTFIDYVSSALFIADYVIRWFTADLKLKNGSVAFVMYPFTPMAILDLLSILPVFTPLADGFRLLRLSRLLRTLRVIRALKMIRYSRSCIMIRNAVYGQRHALVSSYFFAIFYLFVSALLVFNVEPQTFDTFGDALYWAAVSLTTVGYGDIYPVSALGRCVTVLSSFVGIAIVALPAGIITAGYMSELEAEQKKEKE